MAATSSFTRGGDNDIRLEELIFSCSICSATVSDVYKIGRSNKGFHGGSGDDDGLVTKMWIAGCSHVTCSKHLEGGAAPFHPEGVQPAAPCPRCTLLNDDHSPKALFAIRGLGEGEYDPAIPSEWRKCPAIKLDSSMPGMEAVRFQYMALVHYGRRVRHSSRDLVRKLHAMETAFSKERKQRRQLQTDVHDLQARLERLDEVESKLRQWEARKTNILHYLGVFGEMMKEIHGNRALLRNFGYQITEKSYAFPGDVVAQGEKISERQQTGKPNLNSVTTAVARETEGSSSARKRKRETEIRDDDEAAGRTRGSSRRLMPPPLPSIRPVRNSYRPQQSVSGHRVAPLASQNAQIERHFHPKELPYRPPPPSAQLSRLAQPPTRQRREDVQDHLYQGPDLHAHQPYPVHESAEQSDFFRKYVQTTSAYTQPTAFEPKSTRFTDGFDRRTSGYDDPYGEFSGPGFGQSHNKLPLRDSAAYEHAQTQQSGAYTRPVREVHPAQSLAMRSPFFKAGAPHDRPETVHPPTRGSHFEDRGANSRQILPTVVSRPPIENSFSARLRHSVGEPHDEPFQRYTQHSQQSLVPSQTPPALQSFLQRPDRLAPSAMSHAPSGPGTNTFRSPVTLPPNNGRAFPSYGEQDGVLSRIQGVRGLTSRQSRPAGHAPPPAFGAPRQLFSAAGSRRSVRR